MALHQTIILRTLLAIATIAMAPALFFCQEAIAQDDWQVRRNPFDKGIITRHQRALRKDPNDKNSLRKLVALYRRHRSVAQLISEYEAAQTQKPSFSNLLVLGHLHKSEKNIKVAKRYYQQAVQEQPRHHGVHLVLAELARDENDNTAAREHYVIALDGTTKKSNKIIIMQALADLSAADGNINSATLYFRKLIALQPKNHSIPLQLARILTQFKRYDEAIKLYRKSERRLRSDTAARIEIVTSLGETLEAKGDDLSAVREYERGIQLVGRRYHLAHELTIRIIEIYRRRQELDVLIGKLETSWPKNSREYFEWDTLGRLYEENGKPRMAISAYRHATRKAPHELDTQRRFIALLDNSGEEADALKQYEIVIRTAPGESRFQLELARRYWKNGNAKKAIAMAKRIESHFANTPGVVSELAEIYSSWNQFGRALASYKKLVRMEPSNPRHIENLGEHYLQQGNKQKAQNVWKQLIRTANAQNYERLAHVYAEHDLLTEGLTMYDKAIQLEPKKASLFKGRAMTHQRMRKWDRSVADWETVLQLSPDKKEFQEQRSEARRHIIICLQHAGAKTLNTHINKWELKFSQNPPDISAGYYLVQVYDRTSQPDRLIRVLKRLIAVRPSDVVSTQKLAKTYRSEEKFELAIDLLLALAKLHPGLEHDCFNQIAEIKTHLQQDNEAIEFVKRSMKRSPNDSIGHQRLAERYLAMQKQKEAIRSYEKAIEVAPQNYEIYFILAHLYINQGQREKAASLYRTVISTAADQELLRRAGQEAVELEWLNGSLRDLERAVAPLVVSYAHKPIYRRLLVAIYDRYVPELVDEQKNSNPATRAAATAELQRLGTHGLRPLLEALGDDSDIRQQEIAVSVLGYLGNVGAAVPLVRLATTKAQAQAHTTTTKAAIDWNLRLNALIAAGRLGDSRTIPDLVTLSKSPELTMRQAAVFALGMTRSDKALRAVLQATNDAHDSVQTLACLGMVEINDNKTVRQAIKIVGDESRGDLPRAACAWLLGVKHATSAQSTLMGALAHGNDQTQRLAAWALGTLGDKRSLPALMTAYFSKRDPVRSVAATALEQVLSRSNTTATSPPKPPLSEAVPLALRFPMTSQRFDAERAIAELVPNSPIAFDASQLIGQEENLTIGLRATIAQYRDLVLQVLLDLDASDNHLALGALTATLANTTPDQRSRVYATLEKVATALSPEFETLSQHRDPEVRRRTLNVLAKLGGTKAIALLKTGLADSNIRVRQSAIESAGLLARLHRDNDSAALLAVIEQQLGADQWQERVSAATALASWPDYTNTGRLVAILHSDDFGFVRSAAARALGKLRQSTPTVVHALVRAADSKQEPLLPVRLDAVKALRALGGSLAEENLRRISQSDPDRRVRRVANGQK